MNYRVGRLDKGVRVSFELNVCGDGLRREKNGVPIVGIGTPRVANQACPFSVTRRN